MKSFVHRGKAFEESCASLLKCFLFDLRVVGRAGDNGIDLRGKWILDLETAPTTIVQCKRTRNKISSIRIRELEGTLTRENQGTVAFLASNSPLTGCALNALQNSPFPLGFMHFLEVDEHFFSLQKCFINGKAQQILPHLYSFQREQMLKLFWKDKVIN